MINFKKFSEIKQTDLLKDHHIHSSWTDGKGSVKEIVAKAEELGLVEIALTDHIREDSTYFSEYLREIKQIREKANIKVYGGFEARIKNFQGELDVSKKNFNDAELKIGSVHRFLLGRQLYCAKEFKKNIAQNIELDLSIAAIRRKEIDVLGHAGCMSISYFDEFPEKYFEEIIAECAKNEVAFGLDSSYHRSSLPLLKKLLKKYNPLVSFGSDAHELSKIGNWTKYYKIGTR